MKKGILISLALVLCLALGATAFAASSTNYKATRTAKTTSTCPNYGSKSCNGTHKHVRKHVKQHRSTCTNRKNCTNKRAHKHGNYRHGTGHSSGHGNGNGYGHRNH